METIDIASALRTNECVSRFDLRLCRCRFWILMHIVMQFAMLLSSKISALSHQSSFLVVLKSCGFKRCCWKCHSAIYQIKGISSHMITLVELLMYAAAQINWANVLRGLIGLIWFVWMIGKVRERRLVACPQQFWLIRISVNNDWSSHLSATKHLISWEKLFPEVTN